MLRQEEAAAVADRFGATDVQVRRDHLLSHLLAGLSASLADRVVFIGGTALNRSFLPEGRLSEDLDLVAVGSRNAVVADVEKALVRGVRREYPRTRWEPPLTAVRDVDPAVLVTENGLRVRVQLLDPAGLPPWPVQRQTLNQRYSDAPTARLLLPTLPAFAAAKTIAWIDRAAPRDLFDLWQLAQIGAIDGAAAAHYRKFGPSGALPQSSLLGRECDELQWRRELSGQTRLTSTAAEASERVVEAWGRLE